jgi:threonylcarbamoyladenosine tRNA methylthiotransferase MtaB
VRSDGYTLARSNTRRTAGRVTAEAVRQARQQVRRLRRDNPEAQLIVTGCAAQTEPGTFAAMPEVDLVLGNGEKLRPEAWARLAGGGPAARVDVPDIMAERRTAAPLVDGLGTRARAYVQVQTGCDHRCTFCIIPYGRGNSRSVPAATVVAQVARLVDRGFNEVVLTGVDVTSWGADLEAAPRLGDLVAAVLAGVPDLPRLRLSSIDQVEADPLLLETIGGEPRLMPHLHLSLQAGDDMILKRMKRRHLSGDAIAFCEAVREARPDVVFGADIIAGFPTETEAMFENSLRLVEACGLTWLHVFPYSARAGTPAARMPQVDAGTIRERAARLRALGTKQVSKHLAAMHGRPVRLLMERPGIGRTEGFAQAKLAGCHDPGALVSARVTGRDADFLLAEAA